MLQLNKDLILYQLSVELNIYKCFYAVFKSIGPKFLYWL